MRSRCLISTALARSPAIPRTRSPRKTRWIVRGSTDASTASLRAVPASSVLGSFVMAPRSIRRPPALGDGTLESQSSVPANAGHKPAKSQNIHDRLSAPVLAALRKKYSLIFGCEWDATPWGTRWKDLLASIVSADHQYDAAVSALRAIASTVDKAIAVFGEFDDEVVERHEEDGHERAIVRAAELGWTLPEALLWSVLFDKTAHLGRVRGRIQKLLDQLERPPLGVAQSVLGIPLESGGAGSAPSPGTPMQPREGPIVSAGALDRIHEHLRRFPGRRISAMRFESGHGDLEGKTAFVPALLGRPPRARDGAEWRRGTLAALLDAYPLHPEAEKLKDVFPSDGEIAVVSLLVEGALVLRGLRDIHAGATSPDEELTARLMKFQLKTESTPMMSVDDLRRRGQSVTTDIVPAVAPDEPQGDVFGDEGEIDNTSAYP